VTEEGRRGGGGEEEGRRHLLDLRPIDAHARAPAHDLRGENKVLKGRVVDRGEGAGEGALLLVGAVLAALAGEDAALGHNGDMLPRELLFQLTDQALLDPVEGLEKPEGDVDDDCLAPGAHIDLGGRGDVQILKVSLHVGLDLEVEDGTSHELLESIGLGTTLLGDLVASPERHPAPPHKTRRHCLRHQQATPSPQIPHQRRPIPL
jgi:hypothetical protein